jgi:hypothetical protein
MSNDFTAATLSETLRDEDQAVKGLDGELDGVSNRDTRPWSCYVPFDEVCDVQR